MSLKDKRHYWLAALAFWIVGCSTTDRGLETWQHARSGLYDAAYSDDGRFAVVSAFAGDVHYWDLIENRSLYKWRHNKFADNGIEHIDFSPDGSRVITADKNTYVVWNTMTGRALGYWKVDADILDVAISAKGRTLLIGLDDGRALHITQQSGRRLEVIAHSDAPVTAVALSPDGGTAVTGGDDSRAMVWDTHTGKKITSFEHRSPVILLVLDREGRRVLSADKRAGAFVWDLRSGEKLVELAMKQRQYVISAGGFSLDGKQLVTGTPGRSVSVWDGRTGELLKSWYVPTRRIWPPEGAAVQAVAFAQNGRSVVAAASNGYGHRWAW